MENNCFVYNYYSHHQNNKNNNDDAGGTEEKQKDIRRADLSADVRIAHLLSFKSVALSALTYSVRQWRKNADKP
jgi:hypothetical protein